ncbi:MAG: UPF0280 family protein [Candidatus Saccharibacteria bacterium]
MSGNSSERGYRDRHQGRDLKYFTVRVKETDLNIGVDPETYSKELAAETERFIIKLRAELESYISLQPAFHKTLEPITMLPGAPPIAREMARTSALAGVGPMASVAGAFAQEVGQFLGTCSKNVIVENGGDLYIKTSRERLIGVYAGNSPFSNKIAVRVYPHESPVGICTSSGTVGPSFSFGIADAAMVKADSAYLADAVASGVGNRVHHKDELMPAVEYASAIKGVSGVLVIKEDKMAAWGNIELAPLD